MVPVGVTNRDQRVFGPGSCLEPGPKVPSASIWAVSSFSFSSFDLFSPCARVDPRRSAPSPLPPRAPPPCAAACSAAVHAPPPCSASASRLRLRLRRLPPPPRPRPPPPRPPPPRPRPPPPRPPATVLLRLGLPPPCRAAPPRPPGRRRAAPPIGLPPPCRAAPPRPPAAVLLRLRPPAALSSTSGRTKGAAIQHIRSAIFLFCFRVFTGSGNYMHQWVYI